MGIFRSLSFVFVALALLHSSSAVCQWKQTDVPDTAQTECFAQIGTDLFAGTINGVFLSTNNGTHWNLKDTSLRGISTLAVVGQDLLAGVNGGMFLSRNKAMSWNKVTPDYSIVNHLAVSDGKLFVAYESLNGVDFSTDTGSSWTLACNGIPLYKGWHTWVSGFAVSTTNIFAMANYRYQGVSQWNDSDSIWTPVNFANLPFVQVIWADDSNLLAETDSGCYLSHNNGTNWIQADHELPLQYTINAFAASDTNYYIGTRNGVFFRTINGTSWSQVNSGLTDTNILALKVSGSSLFAGIYNGVWHRPLSEMISTSAVAEHTPPATHNAEAYPNPLTHTTTIRFSSSERGFAQVTVVNLLCEQVAKMFEGDVEAGEHNFTWSPPASVGNGVYECLVRVNGETQRVPIQLSR